MAAQPLPPWKEQNKAPTLGQIHVYAPALKLYLRSLCRMKNDCLV